MTAEDRTTNEVQMIATEVVDRQSRYCAVKMKNIEDKVDGLARQVARLTDIIEEMREADQKMRERCQRRFWSLCSAYNDRRRNTSVRSRRSVKMSA